MFVEHIKPEAEPKPALPLLKFDEAPTFKPIKPKTYKIIKPKYKYKEKEWTNSLANSSKYFEKTK